MATKKLKSYKGRRLRLTRLDECGAPAYGAAGSIVTGGFITVTIGREEEAGDETTQKNAWGELCISEKDPDVMKWANVSVQMCEIDPGVLDIMAGALPITSGTDTIGAFFGQDAPIGGYAVEVWTKVAGIDACVAGAQEWGYVSVPNIKNGKLDGDFTIENGPLNITLAGQGFPATADWGLTPYGDNPLKLTGGFLAGQIWAVVRTDVQPPDETVGAVALTQLPSKSAVDPGDVFAAEPTVTAQDSTNAAKLAPLGYVVAPPGTAWATGEFFAVGTFHFNWSGTAWAAGPHA